METSLLITKLNIPPARPQLVTRPRLTDRLQGGLNYNLILVSAPAGFGKTTLLSEWARHSQPRTQTAWVSLNEGDNDPVRFWEYCIAALRTLHPDCGKDILPLLHSPQPPPTESILTLLINDIAGFKGEFLSFWTTITLLSHNRYTMASPTCLSIYRYRCTWQLLAVPTHPCL